MLLKWGIVVADGLLLNQIEAFDVPCTRHFHNAGYFVEFETVFGKIQPVVLLILKD